MYLHVPDQETGLDSHMAPDKREYQLHIFLISTQKHMLWLLIRSASVRCF